MLGRIYNDLEASCRTVRLIWPSALCSAFQDMLTCMLKSLCPTPLSEKQLFHVGQILELIRQHICYDPDYRHNIDILDKIGQEEEEDRMFDFRKDFFTLLRNVGCVAPDVTQIFIHNSLANAVSSPAERNVEEVEAALSMFHALGESINDEAMKYGNGGGLRKTCVNAPVD
ncbi:hypothetical protein QQ045_016750 [Rhodiola kirilowii]